MDSLFKNIQNCLLETIDITIGQKIIACSLIFLSVEIVKIFVQIFVYIIHSFFYKQVLNWIYLWEDPDRENNRHFSLIIYGNPSRNRQDIYLNEWSLISRNIARYNASSRFHELDLFERVRSYRWIFMKCANRSSRCAPTYFNAKRQNAIDTCQSSNETNRSVHVFLSLLSPQKLPFDGVQLFDPVL